jgi:tryptophanyl-tRNA synthetase
VPEVTELAWLIGTVCPMAWMEKMTSYKDKVAKGMDASTALFTYPILQAADILAPQAEIVPVGRDQVQHIEITRDLAARFNSTYGAEVFRLPAHRLAADAEILPGTDGEKMSKSRDNTIDPFLPEKALRSRIMGITTDSTPVDQPKDPDTCTVFRIFRALAGASDPRTRDLAARYRDPALQPGGKGFGYGHAKLALVELILDHFRDARRRREALIADPGQVDAILRQGAMRARALCQATTQAARVACGLS